MLEMVVATLPCCTLRFKVSSRLSSFCSSRAQILQSGACLDSLFLMSRPRIPARPLVKSCSTHRALVPSCHPGGAQHHLPRARPGISAARRTTSLKLMPRARSSTSPHRHRAGKVNSFLLRQSHQNSSTMSKHQPKLHLPPSRCTLGVMRSPRKYSISNQMYNLICRNSLCSCRHYRPCQRIIHSDAASIR